MLAKSVSLTRLKYTEKCIIEMCREQLPAAWADSQFEDKVIDQWAPYRITYSFSFSITEFLFCAVVVNK